MTDVHRRPDGSPARLKLLIWDNAWAPWADDFAPAVDSAWGIEANAGDRDWLAARIPEADALLAVTIPSEALPLARNLKVFLNPGAGLLLDGPLSIPAGCRAVNVYEHETAIAEHVLLTMLLHATRLLQQVEAFRAGTWECSGRLGGVPHGELRGRTVGIFGYGHIGQAVAARARAFGMRIAAVSRSGSAGDVPADFLGGPERLPELLRQSDYLVIATPLTQDTRARIGRLELALLPRGAFLVNVARAEIVREQDLYDALVSGHLAGAALDVWYQYPAAGQPGYGSKLPFHTLPNVICTPHSSAWTRPMILRRIAAMSDNLNRFARGEKLLRVVMEGAWRP